MRALLLASESVIASRVVAAWLQGGHEIAEVWCDGEDPLARSRYSVFQRLYPEFSAGLILRRHGVPIMARPAFKEWPEAAEMARETGADVLISALFLRRIPVDVLAVFQERAVNVHPALLPDYRGPAPTRGMLLDGRADACGGVTLHVVTKDFDEGPIIAQRHVPRSASSNGFEWSYRLAEAAGMLIASALLDYLSGARVAVPQNPAAGSYRRLSEEERRLGPHLSAAQVQQRFERLGPHHSEAWPIPGKGSVQVAGWVARLGGRSGEATSVRTLHLDTDVTDGRVRLRRRTPWLQMARSLARAKARHAAARRIRRTP